MGQPFDFLPEGVHVGGVVAGKYRVEEAIGAGAMGVVVAAWHLLLEEKVAIKFLLPQAVQNRDAVARFVREARAAVKIKSEHVARVADIAFLDDGTPYIVMEFLEGEDLAAWLRQRGPLPVAQAVEFILQACEALAEAHTNGIVHRDLKPANLFVVRRADGVRAIKVLDFGISKIMARSASGPTTTESMIVGSPVYMSPEQMESARDVDAQTDIWALGVILCELVSGRLPFEGASLPQVYAQIVAPGPGPREALQGIVPELEAIIAKCIERHRERRYRDVGELAAALVRLAPKRAHASVDRIARVLGGGAECEPEPAPPPSAPVPHTLAIAERTLASNRSVAPSTKRVRIALVGAGIAVVLIATALSIGLVQSARSTVGPALVAASAARRAEDRGPLLPDPPSPSPERPAPLVGLGDAPATPLGSAPKRQDDLPPERTGPAPSVLGPASRPRPSSSISSRAASSASPRRTGPPGEPGGPGAASAAPAQAPAGPAPAPSSAASSLDITPYLTDPK